MKKRVLMSLVLLAFVTVGAAFAQSPTPDKLKFAEAGKTDYSVKKANDNISGAVVIPSTYSNKPVTLITDSAFTNCKNITSVTIPASVTLIGGSAFSGCTSLTSVTFGGKNTVMVMAGLKISFPGDLYDVYKAGGAGTYTRTAGGNNWTKGSATASAPAPSLNGKWRIQPAGNVFILISGNNAVYSDFYDPVGLIGSAADKGYIKEGTQYLRNLKSTGNSTWSGQVLEIRYNNSNPNVATGTRWVNCTLTKNGVTFTVSNGDKWIDAGVQ